MGMIRDEIPGGVWIENLGPKPVKVYSHSERRDLMRAAGVEEFVRHQPVPGSDKSPHTTRWTGSPEFKLPKHYEDIPVINVDPAERPASVDQA